MKDYSTLTQVELMWRWKILIFLGCDTTTYPRRSESSTKLWKPKSSNSGKLFQYSHLRHNGHLLYLPSFCDGEFQFQVTWCNILVYQMNASVQAYYIFKVFPVKIQNTWLHMTYGQRQYSNQFNFLLFYVHHHKMSSTYYYAVCARTTYQVLTTASMGTVRGGSNKHLRPPPLLLRKLLKLKTLTESLMVLAFSAGLFLDHKN